MPESKTQVHTNNQKIKNTTTSLKNSMKFGEELNRENRDGPSELS